MALTQCDGSCRDQDTTQRGGHVRTGRRRRPHAQHSGLRRDHPAAPWASGLRVAWLHLWVSAQVRLCPGAEPTRTANEDTDTARRAAWN